MSCERHAKPRARLNALASLRFLKLPSEEQAAAGRQEWSAAASFAGLFTGG